MSSVREIESELLQELALERPDFAGATLDASPNLGPRRDGMIGLGVHQNSPMA